MDATIFLCMRNDDAEMYVWHDIIIIYIIIIHDGVEIMSCAIPIRSYIIKIDDLKRESSFWKYRPLKLFFVACPVRFHTMVTIKAQILMWALTRLKAGAI